MNKRIMELADQILPNEREFHKGDPKDWGYFFSGDELEKFAELIVQDCLAEAMDEVQYHADWTLADSVAKRIKEHFGIR